MIEKAIADLKARKLVTATTRKIDLKHLLSAERAARGSFYATSVGFVAINPRGHRIVRSHNGFPMGVTETRERWSKSQKDFYHLHGECAGIFHAASKGYACEGATAYVTHPPCPGCIRALIAAGFVRVVFSEQALIERLDWRDDMLKSFDIAARHRLALAIYHDHERSLKDADITRTELELKKIYDALLPQARWSSEDKSEISPATKPESPEWVEHPAIATLIACAKKGVALEGRGIILGMKPECRTATAIIQARMNHVIIMPSANVDARWTQPLELERAEALLKDDARIRIDLTATASVNVTTLFHPGLAPAYLDTRETAIKMIPSK